MSISRAFLSTAVIATAATALMLWSVSEDPTLVEGGPPLDDFDATLTPPMRGELPTVEAGAPPETRLVLPDGMVLPVLNGAYGAPSPKWPENRPWSPVVRKEVDNLGYEWYVHADGSKTITQIVFDRVSGKQMVATNTFPPTDPLPIRKDESSGNVRKKK